MAGIPGSKPEVLNGWKEIAGYLGRGVRTAQRYEQTLQMPVRRFGAQGAGSSVIALPNELDAWLKQSATVQAMARDIQDSHDLDVLQTHRRIISQLSQNLSTMMERIVEGKRIRRGESVFPS